MPGSHNLIENKLFKIPFLCFLLKDNFCNYNTNIHLDCMEAH